MEEAVAEFLRNAVSGIAYAFETIGAAICDSAKWWIANVWYIAVIVLITVLSIAVVVVTISGILKHRRAVARAPVGAEIRYVITNLDEQPENDARHEVMAFREQEALARDWELCRYFDSENRCHLQAVGIGNFHRSLHNIHRKFAKADAGTTLWIDEKNILQGDQQGRQRRAPDRYNPRK